jgi:hypothetical protein
MKFRKKPVVIEATQWDGTYLAAKQIETMLGLNTLSMTSHPPSNSVSYWRIGTLEGGHEVSPLDWIITGVKGEHYPCKPDIFVMTYEFVAAAAQPEALELADHLDDLFLDADGEPKKAAAELRRLHAEVERLSYRLAYPDNFVSPEVEELRAIKAQLLEALENTHTQPGCEQWIAERKASVALRAAIPEAEKQDIFCDSHCVWTDHHPDCGIAEKQEPVAWGVDWGKAGDTPCVSIIKRLADGRIEVLAIEYGPTAAQPVPVPVQENTPVQKPNGVNRRIAELAEQADEYADNKIQMPGEYHPDWHDIRDEKFAKLIVRECCEQLVKEGEAWEQFSRNPLEGQETNTGAALFAAYRLKEDAVSRLEKHFGVE